jgi:fatty acid desaturase
MSAAPLRAAVPRALLAPATPARLLSLAALDWVVIAGCGLATHLTPAWAYPLWAALAGGRLHALATLAHEASHRSGAGSRSPALTVLEWLAAWPVGTSVRAMRAHHARHHRDTNLPTDPYARRALSHRPFSGALAWTMALLLYPFWVGRALLGACALFVPRLRPRYQAMLLMRDDLECSSDELGACLRSELPLAVFLLAVGVATILWPVQLALGYFVPLLFGFAFNATRLLSEHRAEQVADRSTRSVLSATRDTGHGLLAALFLAPHNLGYHVMHHLHPEAGFASLPALQAWYREHAPDLFSTEGR